jgi:hypothetical protein
MVGLFSVVDTLLPTVASLALAGVNMLALVSDAHAADRAPVAEVTLSMMPAGDINPLIYGVNYDWSRVPAAEFRRFHGAILQIAHYTIVRFPSGWNAEWYDWASNRLVGGRLHAEEPGVDPETLLSVVPAASFITPSEAAIHQPSLLADVVQRTVDLVNRYGKRVRIWEIGNEWWLQSGAKNHPGIRDHNLEVYSALVAAVAPAMKAVNPAIEIYATGDWINPQEFTTLRRLVGPAAWSAVDGISVHTYCGTFEPEHLCGRIVDNVAAIRSITGKEKIYDSEWAVAKRLSRDDYGIRNASETILAIQDLALAHITAAAYWPPVKALPALAFVSADYQKPFATGVVFGWMSIYYRGQALRTGGDLAAAAARNQDRVTVFVPARGIGPRTVRIRLAGTGLSRVVSAEVMHSAHPDDPDGSRDVQIGPLSVFLQHAAGGDEWAEFVVNPGTPGRGSNWEIARVTLQ